MTDAVHARGKIVVQLMHTGRVTHIANLPAGAEVVGSTSGTLPGEMWTDSQGMQPHSPARAMTAQDISAAVAEYAAPPGWQLRPVFDGVELHAANGYLIEQFLNANANQRTDGYGGSIEGRNRFALEVARAACAAIGSDKVGDAPVPVWCFQFDRALRRRRCTVPGARERFVVSLLYLHA